MNSLGDYTHCPWCGLEHAEFGADDCGLWGEGYEIAFQSFDCDGTLETLDALHDGYLCVKCAQIAAAGRELLDALRNALDRGYFDPHPDDSEQEADEKTQARAAIAKAQNEEGE